MDGIYTHTMHPGNGRKMPFHGCFKTYSMDREIRCYRMIHARQKRIERFRTCVSVTVFLFLLAGSAAAYELSIDAPTTIQKGMPLVVNGTSNLPSGISVDVVLSRSEYTLEEINRTTVTLQATKDFYVIFDTKDLAKGQYKVEVPGISGYSFLGDSTTIRIVQIIDRSEEITIKSPRTQEMNGKLEVRGVIPVQKNSGVQIQVIGPENEVVFGPEYISTSSDGSFSREIQIDGPGTYEVSFSDSKGYIGTYDFLVTPPPELTTIPTPTEPAGMSITATSQASSDHPAYFVITGTANEVKVSTSPGIDWVIEYPDAYGVIRKVNNRGQVDSEEVTIPAGGTTIYLKVYPYRFSDKGEVTIFTEGAERIGIASEVPPAFAPTTSPTPKSPFPAVLVILALLVIGVRKVFD